MNKNNTSSLLGWFIGGASLGVVAALLMAPQKGSRTRKSLLKKAEKGKKSFLESSQEIIEKGRELFERGREIAEEAAEAIERTRRIAEKKVEERF